MKRFLIADVGSTTTKVLLIDNNEIVAREEAKTTVEKPEEDVQIGLNLARQLLEQRINKKIEDSELLFSSSAGGGLQIIAIGITKTFTAQSAYKLALNSGAIVIDTIAFDDGRTPFERLQVLDSAKPDLILFAGGFENGAVRQLIEIAQLIALSKVNPKVETGKLPIIYAGNSMAFPFIKDVLENKFILKSVPNINPKEGSENFAPAKQTIIDTFINHVMSSAPGYRKLSEQASLSPIPTPIAVEKILALYSQHTNKKIYAFDMGGATTDCYSIYKETKMRSVAANLGMTYSLPYVLKQCGIKKIMSCLDKTFTPKEVLNFIGNRFIRPITISYTERESKIEEAIAENVIRESFKMHQDLIKMSYDMVIASGGFIAHHSQKDRVKQIIKKALHLKSNPTIAVDNFFILPHLGVLSQVNETLAIKLFKENVHLL